MFEKIAEFMGKSGNYRKIRYIGFSMAWVGMAVGIAVAVTAGMVGSAGLGACAGVMIVSSFVLLPITDIRFPKSGLYY